MRVPRPDLDALIWLTGREPVGDEQSDVAEHRLHAVKGTRTHCGYTGELDVQRVLWIDRAEELQRGKLQQCVDCVEVEHSRGGARGEEMILIYSARQSKKDTALTRHVVALGPAFSEQDYRLDLARTQFGDGIGCMFAIWRRTEPSMSAPSTLQRRRIP